jgi:hypothetical protein
LPDRPRASIQERATQTLNERITTNASTSAQEKSQASPVLPLREMPYADPQAREALQNLPLEGGGLTVWWMA